MQLTSSFRFQANGIQRAAERAENRATDDVDVLVSFGRWECWDEL